MAKRFTDSEKWKKPFIKKLPMQYKLLWFYILDDCNHAGIWQIDLEIASLRIGYNFKLNEVLTEFGEKVKVFDKDEKWFIEDFIEFQYGELSKKNRAHNSVIALLNKYSLLKNKPLTSPLQGDKDKDKEKDKDKDKDKEVFNSLNKVDLVLKTFNETNYDVQAQRLNSNKDELRKRLIEFLELKQLEDGFESDNQVKPVMLHFWRWLRTNPPSKIVIKKNNPAPWTQTR